MISIYELPSLLRLFLFASLSTILIALVFIAIYVLYSKDKENLYFSYLLSYFIALFLLTISRTPVYDNFNELSFSIVNMVLIVPLIIDVLMYIKKHNIMDIIDAFFLFINLPFFSIVPIWKYLYIFSVYFFLVRTAFMIVNITKMINEKPGIFTIKRAMDSLNSGVLFANNRGYVIFINEFMKKIFVDLNINPYKKIDQIVEAITSSPYVIRNLSINSIIIGINDESYNFEIKKNMKGFYTQIVATIVTKEEKTLKELERTNNELSAISNEINEAINKIKENEEIKESLRLKGIVHDTLAQHLSILHSFILENNIDNLDQIKQMISQMLPEFDKDSNEDFNSVLKRLIESYSIVNVKLHVNGSLPNDPIKASFLINTIRECTTNAIKHGKASNVYVRIKNTSNNRYNISISNDGLVSEKEIIAGNGLSNINYQARLINGKMKISTSPKFKIQFII